MTITAALLGGLALGMFMAISVGPTLFAVLRYSVNHSYKAGLAFILGVSLSDTLFVTLANWAADYLQLLHSYARPLAFAGGLVLVGMGVVGFFKKYVPQRPRKQLIAISNGQYLKIGLSGFLINSLNPALILQWLGAATALAAESGWIRFLFFGSCLALVLSIDVLKVLLADRIRKGLTPRKIMYLQKTSALIILLFGLLLILGSIFNIQVKNPL